MIGIPSLLNLWEAHSKSVNGKSLYFVELAGHYNGKYRCVVFLLDSRSGVAWEVSA